MVNPLLIFFMLARALTNTAYRLVYPFLPVLSRAFGVSPDVFASAMSIRSFAGMINIYVARHTDQRGRKFGMLLGNGLFVGGIALIVLFPSFPMFVIGMGLSSLGKYVTDSAILAYLGDAVPVESRGRAFGIVELGWSLSYLIGIWGVRILMERAGWLGPFPVIGFLGILVWIGFLFWVPPDRKTDPHLEPVRTGTRVILKNPSAVLVLLISMVVASANELVSVVFAVWLEDSHGLTLAALAAAAILIGFAELSGESLVSILTDRLGAIRAVQYGLLLNCLFAVLLPVLGRNAIGAFIGLFLFYLTFEFTIVSNITLISAVPTRSLATLIALNGACHSFGRIVSDWIALPIYYGFGFFIVLTVAVMLNFGGVAALRALARRLRIPVS